MLYIQPCNCNIWKQ